MSPADRAVDPLGTASRSISTASTPASFAASAPQIPAAPAPIISSGTRVSQFPAESKLTALMRHHSKAARGKEVNQVEPQYRGIQRSFDEAFKVYRQSLREQKADILARLQ